MKKILLASLLFFLFSGFAKAQKYLVLFKDKTGSPYSVDRPKEFLSDRSIARRQKQNIKIQEKDLPPNPSYLTQIKNAGGKIWYKTRWMNGVLVEANAATLKSILALPFVKGIDGNISLKNSRQSADNQQLRDKSKLETFSETDLGQSQNQLAMLGADKMQARGFHGEGMMVGVLDAGFQNADKLTFFQHLFTENRIVGTYDFVNNEKSVYEDDSHGTHCLSCLAAFQDGKIVGTAYKASYLLLRTEDVFSESRLEEANWLIGAEYADSVGVDVISTSLGYNQFDDATQNHTYQDMNGHTTLITRAAELATNVGILVVVAAGNEGSGAWHYITAPADADSVIAVGAVSSSEIFANFSSYGPSSDGRVKPDLAAQGLGTTIGLPSNVVSTGNGTSYATPLLAGLATGFWQAFPNLTNIEVRDFLIHSGSQYTTPDNQLGYGIPNFERAFNGALEIEILKKSGKMVFAYPNYTDDFRNIRVLIADNDVKKEYELTLFDTSGRQFWTAKFTDKKFNLPIYNNNFPAGEYLLKVASDSVNVTLRLIKI